MASSLPVADKVFKQPPMPKSEASVSSTNVSLGEGDRRTGGFINACLTLSKADWHSLFQTKETFFLSRLLRGDNSAFKRGINRQQNCTIPMKLRRLLISCGTGMSTIADIRSGSRAIEPFSTICPRYLTYV